MRRALVFVLLVCIVSACNGSREFSFAEWFEGEWEITRSQTFPLGVPKGQLTSHDDDDEIESSLSSSSSSLQSVSDIVQHYSIVKQNGTINLLGSAYDNHTEDSHIDNELSILVEMTPGEPLSGVLKIGPIGGELSPLLSFHFIDYPTTGVFVSVGQWDQTSSYIFTIPTFDKFIITVIPANYGSSPPPSSSSSPSSPSSSPSSSVSVLVGRRIPLIEEQSFFQRNKTMFLIVGVLALQIFLKTRRSSLMGSDPSPSPPPSTATTTATTTATKKSPGSKKKE